MLGSLCLKGSLHSVAGGLSGSGEQPGGEGFFCSDAGPSDHLSFPLAPTRPWTGLQ